MPEQEGENLLPSYSNEDVIASMNAWAQLPAAHLKVALNFWNEREKRDHTYRMKREENRDRLQRWGLIFAFILATTCVGGAIFFGSEHNYWAAALMLGPSVVVILSLFVTRKLDKADLKAVRSGIGTLSQLSSQPPAQ